MTLQGNTAVVTGASRGIGRATALALAGAGARLVIHYGKSASEAESVVASIRAQGGLADAIAADLATPSGVAVLANEIRKMLGDRLDILLIVANAGVSKNAMLKDYTTDDFDNLFATNVRGPLLPGTAACAGARTRVECHSNFISRRPERSWHARSRQAFGPCLHGHKRSNRDSC
jgi:NAD(P)-dependent dehydrogenase (short-subunit alcohol dehydrogenase family)